MTKSRTMFLADKINFMIYVNFKIGAFTPVRVVKSSVSVNTFNNMKFRGVMIDTVAMREFTSKYDFLSFNKINAMDNFVKKYFPRYNYDSFEIVKGVRIEVLLERRLFYHRRRILFNRIAHCVVWTWTTVVLLWIFDGRCQRNCQWNLSWI